MDQDRVQLLNVAYRLLGSLTDAEDAVQESYARWYALPAKKRATIVSPAAWRTTVVGRVCLDVLGSARVRREQYVGEWVPEPLPEPTEWAADPADRVTLDESISMAFLVVLELMTPAERVAFVLHDVFGYPFADVAEIVGRTPAACRQLASSGRRRVRAAAPATAPAVEQADVVRAFRRAWKAADVDALLGLLAPDVTAVGDGGGLVRAELRPVEGSEQVARFFAGRARPGLALLERMVNGRPGLVAQVDHSTVSVLAFDVVDGRIEKIWAVLNPAKLHGWG